MSVHLICFLPIKWPVGDVLSTWYIQHACSGFRMKFNPRSLLHVFLRICWHLWLWYVHCTLLGLLLSQIHCRVVVWKNIGLAVKEVPEKYWPFEATIDMAVHTSFFLGCLSSVFLLALISLFGQLKRLVLIGLTTYIVLKVKWAYGKGRYQWIHQRRLQE